ncbi:hypothetical protein C8R43DRAFT_1125057 [Mycena crocata]|nr:hypothetical protein C8R43DRAFT_1125057 [Mycena crocata]
MAKSAPPGNKPRKKRKKPSNDSKTFKLGLDDDEKAKRHCKAQSQYYARNAEARARRREQAASRKLASKLKKRRWDPPKKASTPPATNTDAPVRTGPTTASETSGEHVDFKDPRAESCYGTASYPIPSEATSEMNTVGSAASPTSNELLASHALAELAAASPALAGDFNEVPCVSMHRGPQFEPADFEVNENAIDDWRAGSDASILRKADMLSSHSSDIDPYLRTLKDGFSIPPAELSMRITGDIGALSLVQSAQIRVAMRNSGVLTVATPEEAEKWVFRRRTVSEQWSPTDLTRKELNICSWRLTVFKAMRNARLGRDDNEIN